MFRKAILTASALALFSAPALADDLDFAGTLTGQYSHIGLDNLPDAEVWGVNGAGAVGLGDTGLNAELDAGYNHLTVAHAHANDWNIGGSLFWKGAEGRVGVNVNYTQANAYGLTADTTNYGGFGEYYANDMFTFSAKAGGFSGDIDGAFVAGGVTGYVFPDFAASLGVSYNHIDNALNETGVSLNGEYLLSEEIPVSAFVGYTYSSLSNGGGNANTVFVGLRLYTNSTGTTLVERQRNGTTAALTAFGPLGLNF
ncbi:MAG TPA: hypothetical protein VG891_10525 [Rhizomicrobium sp.]|nr:hypothetical protein [Rhizomicrobium sp.]